ncbi:uncharacterized protein Dmul_14890 [Desulfococcus multivorans]|nr:uncharacterized protein Dmul_14890 [Desulfococcus multivorans]
MNSFHKLRHGIKKVSIYDPVCVKAVCDPITGSGVAFATLQRTAPGGMMILLQNRFSQTAAIQCLGCRRSSCRKREHMGRLKKRYRVLTGFPTTGF